MRVNESDTAAAGETAVLQSRGVFSRMNGYIGRLAKNAKAEDVHRFRTNSRRVEALVDELAPESGNKCKLLKLLAKARKKAGKVRDLDVQIAFLKELTIPDHHGHRTQLLETLAEEQQRRSRKLAKFFDQDRADELRKRLRKAQSEIKLDGVDPLKLAFERLPNPGATALNERMLHACRIAAKRARYLAELAPESADARTFVEELKRAQDEIGQWHDVLKLTERAEQIFGEARDSALVSALQNVTHARFRSAANALEIALKKIPELQKKAAHQPPRKAGTPAAAGQSAAA